MANEAFARVKIDQLLKDANWPLTDGYSVRFEYPLYIHKLLVEMESHHP